MFGINADGTFPEIGQKYDFGIGTRDGTNLACLNKDGETVQVSRIAYMQSIDKNNKVKESTELQEKAKLVQLATSNTIDREIDQWVQNTQGDWSAGIGQRVYGQQGVTNAYFDGEGLLWPTNDWIPQVAMRGPTQPLPAFTIAGPSQPDSGTSVITPGGAAAATQAAGAIASFKASGGAVSRVGALGAVVQGTNTQVTGTWGQATTGAGTHFGLAQVSGQRRQTSGSTNLGDTGSATYSYDFAGASSDNVIGTSDTFVVPGGGIYINSISCYMGGYTAAVNTIFVVWNASNGAVIVNSSNTSLGQGLSLKTLSVTQTFVAAGTVLRIGFWRQQNQDAMWGVANGGSFTFATNQSGLTNPTNGCSSPYVCGTPQFFLTYSTSTTSDMTCSTAGWVLVSQSNSPDGNQQFQIWKKEALANGEVNPVFNAAAGATPMAVQIGEFQNIATSSSNDQNNTNTSTNQTNLTVANPAIDNVAGDLVAFGARWSLNGAQTATFSDTMNNQMVVVHGGDTGLTSLVNHTTFNYGIIPTGVAQFVSFGPNASTIGGYIDGIGNGYAAVYLDNQGPPGHWHAVFFSNDQVYDVDIGANTGSQQGPLNMHIAGGYLWILFSQTPNVAALKVLMLGCPYGSNIFQQLRSDALPTVAGTSGFAGLIQASFVGGHLYVAVLQADQNSPPQAPTVNRNALFVLDYSAGVATAPTGLGAAAFVFPFERGFHINDLTWQGNQLLCSISDGFSASIYQLSAPFSAITTQAVLPGIANALMCSVGAQVMVIAWTPGPTGVNRLELYTLVGGTLTSIPFSPVVPFLDSVTSCVGFGSYALFAIGYATPGGVAGQKTVTIYAFDLLRTRLFRALTYTTVGWTGSDQFGHDIIGVYGTTTRTLQAGVTFQAQLGLAIFSGFLSNSTETAREFFWGVQPLTPAPNFTGLLQMGVSLISGLFDFTAATNKRFRAKIAHYIGQLVQNSNVLTIQLSAWFNQDPNRLNPAADFVVTTGTPATLPAQTDVYLYEGRVARKTVYQVVSSGGGYDAAAGVWRNAPKITDVIILSSAPMVWDFVVDISPRTGLVGQAQNEYAYTSQTTTEAVSIDHVVAYNFLKQLWIQRGGVCQLYLPNGQSLAALMQEASLESPKPLGAGYRSDTQATWQVTGTLKIREDV